MISIIVLLISFLLEIILPNIFAMFLPFFILTYIILYKGKLRYIFMVGIIYDLMFTKTIILHAFIFLFINFISRKIINNKIITNIVSYILIIVFYSSIMSLYKSIYTGLNYIEVILYIKNSLLINMLYFLLLDIAVICNRNKNNEYLLNR